MVGDRGGYGWWLGDEEIGWLLLRLMWAKLAVRDVDATLLMVMMVVFG